MNELNVINHVFPVIGFVGYSGSGKTTLLTEVVQKFTQRGIRTAVIKHAHHRFDIDTPGKDSYVLRHAGAIQTIVASKHRWALMVETPDATHEPALADLLNQLDPSKLDIVFVEGFKHSNFPKLEIHRPALNKPLLYPDNPDIIALVTNPPVAATRTAIPILDLNDTEQVTQFIICISGLNND